jgi:hypothetical protein
LNSEHRIETLDIRPAQWQVDGSDVVFSGGGTHTIKDDNGEDPGPPDQAPVAPQQYRFTNYVWQSNNEVILGLPDGLVVGANPSYTRVILTSTDSGGPPLPSSFAWAASSLDMISWGPNRLDICGIGNDNQMYHNAWTGSAWTGWQALGGGFKSPPSLASWGPNRLDICAVGLDNQMYHKAWDGQNWSPSLQGWEPLGGQFRAFHSNLL